MTELSGTWLERSGKDLTGTLLTLFKRLIADGSLAPGDRLPPERELAEMTGVSRSSLRQALKVLENLGIISQRVGSGTRLNESAASVLSQPLEFLILLEGISFQELMEARLIVEPELAARAALRASSEDLDALKAAIRAMEESARDSALFATADLAFHQAVYRAAGNRVCTMLFSVVHQSLEQLVRVTSGLVEPEQMIRFHRRILVAIRRGDPAAARVRMREHLEDTFALLGRAEEVRARSTLEQRLDTMREGAAARRRVGAKRP